MGALKIESIDQHRKVLIGPQQGPQTAFLASEADITIYGGAAGGGKTYGLLLDPLRHHDNGEFGGVIFRKTSVQIRNEGGLWDESMKLYSLLAAKPRESVLNWRFPSGMSMSFANLELEKDVLNYQGSQMPWQGWDELTHFSMQQFFYMISRNRSTSGARSRVRATCNPDPDSWVKTFIRWWLDSEGRYADPAKAGKVRWFIRINDSIIWADTPEEIYKQYGRGDEIQPKSVTFIPSKVQDNRILLETDKNYLGNLLALNRVDRARLLDGDWLARATAGTLFQEQWFPIIDAIPAGWQQVVRMWDRAATKPHEGNKDPDWTRGLKMYKYPDGTFVVGDLCSTRDSPGQVERLIKTVAQNDTQAVKVVAHQDPGSAGVLEAENFTKLLQGYHVQTYPVPRDTQGRRDKITRAKPVSAQSEAGNIRVLRAPWNREFFSELENFPEGTHDDIADVFSGAFNDLAGGLSLADVL